MRRMAMGTGLALLVALAGCLPGYLSNQKAGKEGYFALAIEGVDADGQVMRLTDTQGDKVALLSFWSSQ
ncbi:MAG: hypothetical protein U0840_18870 [Gemmataceae bacterium]